MHSYQHLGGEDYTVNLIRLGDIGWVFTETELNIVDETHEKALNLALNKISGEWDQNKLKNVLHEIKLTDMDIKLTGFDKVELKRLDNTLFDKTLSFEGDDAKQELIDKDNHYVGSYENLDEAEKSVGIKHGDLFKLDNHYLLCGDCTNKDHMQKLVQGNKIHIVFIDPPYDFEDNSYLSILSEFSNEIFVMCSDKYLVRLASDYYDIFRYFFTVELATPIMTNSKMPMTAHDLIGYFRVGKTTFKNMKDAFSTHLRFNKRKDGEHRHEKNIELPGTFILHYSEVGDNVLDCFGGSGSTLMACEQSKRNCYMLEFEPVFVQQIIDRWEEYTGKKAEKIS